MMSDDNEELKRILMSRLLQPSLEEEQTIYEKWAKKFFWTSDEAAALATGINPEVVSLQMGLPSDVAERLDDVLDLIRRRFGDQSSPIELLKWAEEMGVAVPAGLTLAVRSRVSEVKRPPRKEDETKKDQTRSIMLLAMARDKYGWDPKRNNSASKQISGATEDLNLRISESTVHSYLKEASEEFSDAFLQS
jgi:hypothetical protein